MLNKILLQALIMPLAAMTLLTPFIQLSAETESNSVSVASERQSLQQLVLSADAPALEKYLQSLSQQQLQQLFILENPLYLLMTSADGCFASTIDVLVTFGAPLTFGDDGTALHYIGYFRKVEDNLNCINKLLTVGLNINQQDRDGYTPLVKLLYSQNEHTADLLRYMLEKGANPLMRSQSGMDFLHHALAVQLLYTEQLYFLPEDDALYAAADKMVATAQFARNLYAEFYSVQQENKIQVTNRK